MVTFENCENPGNDMRVTFLNNPSSNNSVGGDSQKANTASILRKRDKKGF